MRMTVIITIKIIIVIFFSLLSSLSFIHIFSFLSNNTYKMYFGINWIFYLCIQLPFLCNRLHFMFHFLVVSLTYHSTRAISQGALPNRYKETAQIPLALRFQLLLLLKAGLLEMMKAIHLGKMTITSTT